MNNVEQLIVCLTTIASLNVVWWLYLSPREGKSYDFSLRSFYLSNKDLHDRRLVPLDADVPRLVREAENDFFHEPLHGDDHEPSIVIDYAALVDEPLEPVELPRIEEANIDFDLMLPEDIEEDDSEPSIVIDYAQLTEPSTDGRAIELEDEEDDDVPSIVVNWTELEVYREPLEEEERMVFEGSPVLDGFYARKYRPIDTMEQLEMF